MKIESLPRQLQNTPPANPYKEMAQGMEAEYLNYVLNEMRKSVIKEEADSSEVEFYQSLLDNEYAKAITAKEHGIGLQDTILKQIAPREFAPKNNIVDKNRAIEIYKGTRDRE
ncbi:MAG: rod-binding protein [Oligoflexia bacterium]|nr:rod-binding protein [Oligoflexia bacterium]MBF0366112.1 rod-binding protein [Oligoflexia bacterium]